MPKKPFKMRKAFGKKAIYPSDIGCYTMAIGMGTVDTCLCMGASITLASGIRFGGETEGICCSLGDSTFLHAAMTGHQPHPGTGVTATGESTVQVSLEALAKALGAGLVETVDPYDLDKAIECFQKAKEFPGLSVVIARQPCVIKARRGEAGRKSFAVGEDCAGCQICVDFGCSAIEFENDKARINALCMGCGACAKIYTRIGCRFSPMVASGGADVLLALEPAEALRFAHFLSPEGVALVNTTAVLPVTVTTGKSRYPALQEILAP